jgi:hypothetical protein
LRRALEWAFRIFTRQHRQAAENLELGKEAIFPPECFLPAGPFLSLIT